MPLRAWRQLALLTLLAVLFVFLADLFTGAPIRAGGWAGAPRLALQSVPDALFPMFAVVAGLAVGTMPSDTQMRRSALWIVAVMTGAMLVLATASSVAESASRPTAMSALVNEVARGVPVVLTKYAVNHPRVIATETLKRAGMLLLPVILAGMMIGVTSWVHANVIFRAPRSAVIARQVITWILVPGVSVMLISWSDGYSYSVLFRGGTPLLMLLPYLPALALAVVGWRSTPWAPQLLTTASVVAQPPHE